MPPFRDEHAALLARVEALEEELARRPEPGTERDAVAEQVRALAERVRSTTERIDDERAALAEINDALARIETSVRPAPTPPASSERTRTLLVMTGALVAVTVVVLSIAARLSAPEPPPRIEERDPEKLLALARSKAEASGMSKRAEIRQLFVRYAASDGKLFAGPASTFTPSFEVTFVDASDPGAIPSNAPVGAPAPITMAHDYRVAVSDGAVNVKTRIMPRFGTTAPTPHCSVDTLWKSAIAAGAPADAVATLEYTASLTREGSSFVPSPSWRFSISGTKIDLRLSDKTCAVER